MNSNKLRIKELYYQIGNHSGNIIIWAFLVNILFFIYYCLLIPLPSANDVFYYMSIADSYYNGNGFYDITRADAQPILTPQNGIVFVHIFLKWIGLNEFDSRILVITIINYVAFLGTIYILYKIFRESNVSLEITNMCLGIILLSAYFLKASILPINDGLYCFISLIILYLIIMNNNYSLAKTILIIVLSIFVANLRVNGPLILLSASITYFLLNKIKLSSLYFMIFIGSYYSIYVIYWVLKVDISGMKSLIVNLYNVNFFIEKLKATLIATIPGVFLGISGRPMIIMLPISIMVIAYYLYYMACSLKNKSFKRIFVIVNIMLSLIFFLFIPGYDSRYIILIIPFTLYAIAMQFDKNHKRTLRKILGIIAIVTVLISLVRVTYWDSIYFKNKSTFSYIRKTIGEPYTLISQSPRISYYVFGKRASKIEDIKDNIRNVVIYGDNAYIASNINIIKDKYGIKDCKFIDKGTIEGHYGNNTLHLVEIILK